MANQPSGTVTFLFTDIEGSTKRWEQHPQAMKSALARHDVLLREAIEANGGYVFKTMGDAFCAAFPTAVDALVAILAAQHAAQAEDWGEVGQLRVRAGLHTGMAQQRDDDYFGPVLNRVARLMSAGHGGQTLLSQPAYELVRDHLPSDVELRDMGEHQLKDLTRPERIFQVVTPDLASEFPPLKTLDYRPNNLPRQATALVGRERETADILALLRRPDVALLTLTGPGGTGKTRLGLQAAADLLDDFAHGVWLVELAPITDHSLVMPTIAQVLGVKEAAGQPLVDTLKDFLRDKELLLMLDNFEQVLQAAPQIDALLKSASGLKVLVTSRLNLRVYGEKEFPVPPLALPNLQHLPSLERLTQYEAVRLFIERAQDVKPDFQVTNETAPAVAEICVRLDGLPLAIELAAARVRLLPPPALLSRLQSRLKLLTGGASTLPARQQTLRATIEWSYDLLDDGEKQFFRRMAVFQGGRSIEAMEAVCNADGTLKLDVFDGVESLVSKNLMQQHESTTGESEPRFWMLETIHEYAREKLEESGESENLRRWHALYFAALAEEAEPHLKDTGQVAWLRQLEAERDNIRSALSWSAGTGGTEPELALRIAGALQEFWHIRGPATEGSAWLDRALEASGSDVDPALRAKAFSGLGTLVWHQSDYARALGQHQQALALYQELGDKDGIAFSNNNIGSQFMCLGQPEEATQPFKESLDLYRELNNDWGIKMVLGNLGEIARYQGDYDRAAVYYEECIARSSNDTWGASIVLQNLGRLRYEQGEYDQAVSLFRQSLALGQELDSKWRIARCLMGLAAVAGAQRQPRRAVRLLGVAEVLLESTGAKLDTQDQAEYDHDLTVTRAQLTETENQALWTEGRGMSMERATEYALQEDTNGDD